MRRATVRISVALKFIGDSTGKQFIRVETSVFRFE